MFCSATRASTTANFYHGLASGVRDDRPSLDNLPAHPAENGRARRLEARQPRPQWWSTHRPPRPQVPTIGGYVSRKDPEICGPFSGEVRDRGPRFRLENRLESTGRRSDALGDAGLAVIRRRRPTGCARSNAQRSPRASVPRSTPSRATPINRVQDLPTAGLDKGRAELLDRDPRVGNAPLAGDTVGQELVSDVPSDLGPCHSSAHD